MTIGKHFMLHNFCFTTIFQSEKIVLQKIWPKILQNNYIYLGVVIISINSDNQYTEVFDHDRGTNGTFQLHVEGDQDIFEVKMTYFLTYANQRPNLFQQKRIKGVICFKYLERKYTILKNLLEYQKLTDFTILYVSTYQY